MVTLEITLCSQICVYSQKVRRFSRALSKIITKTQDKNAPIASLKLFTCQNSWVFPYFLKYWRQKDTYGQLFIQKFSFTLFTNKMREISKPELPYLYSKLLESCTLFDFSHISGYIKLSLRSTTFLCL